MYPQPQAMYAPGYVGSGRGGQPGYEDVPNYPTYLPQQRKKRRQQVQPSPTYGVQPNPAATYNPSFGWMGGGNYGPPNWQQYPTIPGPQAGRPQMQPYQYQSQYFG